MPPRLVSNSWEKIAKKEDLAWHEDEKMHQICSIKLMQLFKFAQIIKARCVREREIKCKQLFQNIVQMFEI